MLKRDDTIKKIYDILQNNYIALLEQRGSGGDKITDYIVNNNTPPYPEMKFVSIILSTTISNIEEFKTDFLLSIKEALLNVSPTPHVAESVDKFLEDYKEFGVDFRLKRAMETLGKEMEPNPLVIVFKSVERVKLELIKSLLVLLREFHMYRNDQTQPAGKIRFLIAGSKHLWRLCSDKSFIDSPFNIASRIFVHNLSLKEIRNQYPDMSIERVVKLHYLTSGIPLLLEKVSENQSIPDKLESFFGPLWNSWNSLENSLQEYLKELAKGEIGKIELPKDSADDECPHIPRFDSSWVDSPWIDAFWHGFLKLKCCELTWRSPIHHAFIMERIGQHGSLSEILKKNLERCTRLIETTSSSEITIGNSSKFLEETLFMAIRKGDKKLGVLLEKTLWDNNSSEILEDIIQSSDSSKGSWIKELTKKIIKTENHSTALTEIPLKDENPPITATNSTTFPRPLNILHLSDLHFGNNDDANLWSNQLCQDIFNDIFAKSVFKEDATIHALIISGDITNKADAKEFDAARLFIEKLIIKLKLESKQIIIVPGNHEVNWDEAENAYQLTERKNYNSELKKDCYIELAEDIIKVMDDEEKYRKRFTNFSNFYKAIKGKSYPQEYDEQGIIYHLAAENLLILGLNSAWNLDKYFPNRSNIHDIALSNAINEISNSSEYNKCFKIAVWHHPYSRAGEAHIENPGFIERLAVAGFRLFLHGHIHQADNSLYRHDMNLEGRKLDGICAGTFGAPTKQLATAYPWQYNLLRFKGNQLTVFTRRREKENGAWKPDARWSQGAGESPLDWYEIVI